MHKLSLLGLIVGLGLVAQPLVAESLKTEKATLDMQTLSSGLNHPWAMQFLPDGSLLVTERAGSLRYISKTGEKSEAIAGVPTVHAQGQGGLLGLVLDPDFAKNKTIYFSFSEPRDGGINATAVASAILDGQALKQVKVIFRQAEAIDSNYHYGGRLAFNPAGELFITLGDRGSRRDDAQKLSGHFGKVVKVNKDGTAAAGNPFAAQTDAKADVWSYGHRNLQGAAIHPQTGALWTHEHGPQGGDEINIATAGKNYGWPVITYGEEYGGGVIGNKTKAGLEQPLHYWVPSIAPSGMSFYTGTQINGWQNNLLVGSLKFGQLVRLELTGDKVSHEERIRIGARIRDVQAGPDGSVYLLTDEDDGKLLRLSPQ
ncbi:PQQ-dependent sugar dehydrogenase [Rheinheimera sp. MM224]|uniref:PQQ-dependent sugar dehydrogenase n=1 Tax=Rheinheimera sp. MM224 TaxID=3019969 RepID=UPI0021F844D3|nr:PQQ-dependent sugar dehydrogenase [Rheinheimera sp. MM224]CAI3797041.1 Aldose sugar dehydrogenase YliI [Rheinheimera sp. MM224]